MLIIMGRVKEREKVEDKLTGTVRRGRDGKRKDRREINENLRGFGGRGGVDGY